MIRKVNPVLQGFHLLRADFPPWLVLKVYPFLALANLLTHVQVFPFPNFPSWSPSPLPSAFYRWPPASRTVCYIRQKPPDMAEDPASAWSVSLGFVMWTTCFPHGAQLVLTSPGPHLHNHSSPSYGYSPPSNPHKDHLFASMPTIWNQHILNKLSHFF